MTPLEHARLLLAMSTIRDQWSRCRRCELWKTRDRVVHGRGDLSARIAFVGEGPGREEDVSGLPFVGQAGWLLRLALEASGLRGRYILNLVGCWPPGNRVPSPVEIAACSDRLAAILKALPNLRVVVALGGTSAAALMGVRGITKQRGTIHTLECEGATYIGIPTLHPSYVQRRGGQNSEEFNQLVEDLRLAQEQAR